MKAGKGSGAGKKTKATPDDQRLVERVHDLAPLFRDMLFQPGTYIDLMINDPFLDSKSGKWINPSLPLPPSLDKFSYNDFHFKVAPPKKKGNYYCWADQELCIERKDLDSDPVILHELIHLHSYVFDEPNVPCYFREVFFWALYRHVRQRIPRLDDIVSNQACILGLKMMGPRESATHGLLFLLKSFELDMRKGYRLGTVYGYGRDEDFPDYPYIPYARG